MLLGLSLLIVSCGNERPLGDDDVADDDDDSSGDDDTSGDDDSTSSDDDDSTPASDDDDSTPASDDDDSTPVPGDDDDASPGTCGTIGNNCTVMTPNDCAATEECYVVTVTQGICVVPRDPCGGFLGLTCDDPAAPLCMTPSTGVADVLGMCVTTAEFDCICNGPSGSLFPGLCFPIG